MKQFGKILNFELKNYLKNKAFVGVTLLLVAIIAVVMFFPRITSLFESGDPGDSTADLPVLLVKAEDPAQAEMVYQTFAAAFADYDVQVTDKDNSYIKDQITSGNAEGAFVMTGPTSYTYYVNNLSMYDANEAIANEVLQQIYQMNAMIGSGMTPEQAEEVMNNAGQGSDAELFLHIHHDLCSVHGDSVVRPDGGNECGNGEKFPRYGGADHQCQAR